MEHFISIIYRDSIDKQDIAECLATSNTSINESELEFVTGEIDGQNIIRMALPESVDDVTEAAENLAMKLFDLGLNEFELEITEETSGTLRRGMRGEEVKKLQRQLGMTGNEVDGIFGPATERAVRAFQKQAGIQVDGIVGRQTQSTLLKYKRPGLGVKSVEPGPGYIDAPYPKQPKKDVGGTPARPKEVTRLLVGQLNDYVFDYSYKLYVKYRDTHEVARISDFGNRDNPLILIPRMPIKGQPPTNPKGPLYSNQGIRLDRPKDNGPEDDLVGRARDAIDSSDDGQYMDGPKTGTPSSRLDKKGETPKKKRGLRPVPSWPDNYSGKNIFTIKDKGTREAVADQIKQAYEDKDYIEMWRLIHLYEPFYSSFEKNEAYPQIEAAAEAQLRGMSAEEKRKRFIDPLATTLLDILKSKAENESLDEADEPELKDKILSALGGAGLGGISGSIIKKLLKDIANDPDIKGFTDKATKDQAKKNMGVKRHPKMKSGGAVGGMTKTPNKLGGVQRGIAQRNPVNNPLESLEVTYDDDDKFYEDYGVLWYNEDEIVDEAEYQGRKVKLGKPMKGDVKKFKVYVKNPKGNVVKVNFGQKGVKIKKDNPARRRSFRARHNCDNPGPRHKARYWSCRKW